VWSGAGEPIFHADFARNTGHRARPAKLLHNPAPDVLNGGKNILKKTPVVSCFFAVTSHTEPDKQIIRRKS